MTPTWLLPHLKGGSHNIPDADDKKKFPILGFKLLPSILIGSDFTHFNTRLSIIKSQMLTLTKNEIRNEHLNLSMSRLRFCCVK